MKKTLIIIMVLVLALAMIACNTCKWCDGSGVCFTCDGDGIMLCPKVIQLIAGQVSSHGDSCTMCGGYGKMFCTACNGTGTCQECK